MKKITFLAFMTMVFIGLNAQISQKGTPYSLKGNLNKEVPTYTLEALNLTQLALEDKENSNKGKLERTGVVRSTNLNPYNAGVWTTLENGDRIWRLAIHAEGALATTLLYTDFALPEGAKLFLYQPNYNQIIGAFTAENNHESKQFSTELIHGQKTIIEYYEPAHLAYKGFFTIASVVHVYKKAPWQMETLDFDDSESCEVNINCSEGSNWQDEKRGVARILVVDGNSQGWCTGSLVNNTNLDCKPYFLTAFHCGETSTTANFNNWVFYFNYEATACTTPNFQPIANTITGCALRSRSSDAGNSSSDFLLLEFNNTIPSNYNVYFNGWNRSNVATVSTDGVSIHHPAGDIKKISHYTANLTTQAYGNGGNPTHYRVVWAATANGHGVTEGGSSGSPIFNDQGLILGTLTGGGSFCNATSQPDYYGKVSYHWNSNGAATANNRRLDIWLDPAGNGTATSLAGTYAPCSPSVALDASISVINTPTTDICGLSFTPQVVLKNIGSTTLTSCQVKYQVNGGALQTYSWSGNLVTNATATINLQAMTASAGSNTFNVFTQSPNNGSDQNSANDAKTTTFQAVSGSTLPLSQTFQATTFPPTNYELINADNNTTWARTTTAGFNSTASMFVDNWDYDAAGAYDWFVLPAVNLAGASNPSLTFDYAYAYYDQTNGSNVAYDSLYVAYSLDCGTTWFSLFYEGGTQLATAGGFGTEFVPTSNQWENKSINLNVPALQGQNNVQFAFVAVNGYGNNLYVDNINIQTTSITPAPVANFTTNQTSICAGSSVSFTNTSSNNPTSYSWSFPGGTPSTSTSTSPTISYANPGVYTVTLTAINAGGSDIETKTNFITVNALPSISIIPQGATCQGINNGSITVSPNVAGNYSYSWTNGVSNGPVASNLAPGTYSVTITNSNSCSTTASATVNAGLSVNVQLQVTDSSALGGESSIQSLVSGGTSPYSYLWNTFDTSPNLDSLNVGTYSLTVTDFNGCQGNASASIGNVAIQDVTWLSNVSVYPNPVNEVLNVNLSLTKKQNIELQVLNVLGQVIDQKSLLNFDSGTEQFFLNDVNKGIYFLKISSQKQSQIVKFIKD